MTTLNLILMLLLHSGDGRMPRHCEPSCELYARHLASVVDQAAIEHGVHPYLLVAVGWVESQLNRQATGKVKEFGPWQLHPKSRWGRSVRFFCKVTPHECLLNHARTVAWLLVAHKEDCGSLAGALSMYNSGTCRKSLHYAARTIRLWKDWSMGQ